MKRYQVAGRHIVLYSGTVDLTRAQAEPRLSQLAGHTLTKAHAKASVKSDVRASYTVVGEIHVKVGEVLGYDGVVPKAWDDILVNLDAVEAAAAQAAAAETALEAERAANAQAAQQMDELLAALEGITGDAQGNIDITELTKLLEGRINFQPTEAQLEAAWDIHVERLNG